ncbi:MAG: helix-turn-helix domain-containing protein [Elusimicrobiota bacterium]
MGKQTKLALPQRQATNKTLLFTKDAPAAAGAPPHVYVRTIRATLRMTQEQLARRAGTTKSLVAQVESGKTNVGVETLRKLFDAMRCDLLVVPKARKKPTQALAERELERKLEPEWYNKRGPWA